MSGSSRRGSVFVPLLFLLVLSGTVGPERAAAQEPELVEVHFAGNEVFPDDSLEVAILNRETQCKNFIFRITGLCLIGFDFALDNEPLISEEIDRDRARLRIYYYQRGYREAEIDTSLVVDDDEAELTFEIEEGRPIRVETFEITGLDALDPEQREEIEASLPLEVGDPLSGVLLDASRDTVTRRLRNRGYAHADVLRDVFIPSGELVAEVEFDVDPGPLSRYGELTFRGNQELSEEVLRRFIPFEEGDVYDESAIFQAQRNLYGLDIVRYAVIHDSLEHEPDSVVPLRIEVIEGDKHRVRIGAGWSTADCLNSEARWVNRNFMGGARRLQLRTRVSNVLADQASSLCPQAGTGEFGQINGLLSAEFDQPWLFSPRNSLRAALSVERQSIPDVFVREALGGRLSVSRRIAPGTSLTLSYRPQLSELQAAEIFFCTSFLICRPAEIELLQSSNWLSPVALSFSRDRRDDVLDPSRGYVVVSEVEHASGVTGSNFSYERVTGETSWYTEMGGTVLAARLRAGWLEPGEFEGLGNEDRSVQVSHPEKRFFAGGANSVRGFAQNRLGPRVLSVDVAALLRPRQSGDREVPAVCTPREVLAQVCDPSALGDDAFFPRPTGGSRVLEGNVEARFPISRNEWTAAAFVDFGQVWGEGSSIGLGDLEFTPGVGVRYASPIGPIRVDLAYRMRGVERLPVVTSGLRPLEPDEDDELCVVTSSGGNGVVCDVPWVRTEELVLLDPRVEFGESDAFSLRRLQLHFSIGQAF